MSENTREWCPGCRQSRPRDEYLEPPERSSADFVCPVCGTWLWDAEPDQKWVIKDV